MLKIYKKHEMNKIQKVERNTYSIGKLAEVSFYNGLNNLSIYV